MSRQTHLSSELDWELHRAEITRLRITEGKTLKTIMDQMRTSHGFEASVSSYKRHLSKWKINKYMTRPTAFQSLLAAESSKAGLEADEQEAAGSQDQSDQLRRYLRRNRVPARRKWIVRTQGHITANHGDPENLLPHTWDTHARFLQNVSTYITLSCVNELWIYPDHELLVESSGDQTAEKTALHNFINGIDTGRAMSRCSRPVAAFQFWRYASRQLDTLVHGSYHDILPNILLKLCELCDDGHFRVAQALISHIAALSRIPGEQRLPEHTIYEFFSYIDVSDLPDLYERVMGQFVLLFRMQFPEESYNNHVMRNNLLRRRLKSRPWTTFDHELPSLTEMEVNHGRCNRRPLDILALHAHCALERNSLCEAESIASSLVHRASLIQNDRWLQLYYLFQSYYIRGCAMHQTHHHASAEQNLEACLHVLKVFRDLSFGFMFDTERMDALKRLGEVLMVEGRHEEAERYVAEWQVLLQDMENMDSVECSS